MSMTPCRACGTLSWVATRFKTFVTTSIKASCGKPSQQIGQVVLLIDEIDKADIEFPNDLLLGTGSYGVSRLRDG